MFRQVLTICAKTEKIFGRASPASDRAGSFVRRIKNVVEKCDISIAKHSLNFTMSDNLPDELVASLGKDSL